MVTSASCRRTEREEGRTACHTFSHMTSNEGAERLVSTKSEMAPMIYLDNNATTPLDPTVIDAMVSNLQSSNSFGNPSSSHSIGVCARHCVDVAREHVRSCLNASSTDEIVLTSGGTESNNLAIHSVLSPYENLPHVITSPFEHPSVAHLLSHLSKQIEVSFVKVDSNGTVDLDDLRQLLRPQTRLVTIMHSNNEIGTIQPMEEIVSVCRLYGPRDLRIHTDASQSIGKVVVDVIRLDIDLLTVCSHKFHGPKGIGALYVRRGIEFVPQFYGAQHEQGHRPGTENVLGIVGLGQACQLVANKTILNQRIEQMRQTRDRLWEGLKRNFNQIIVNGGEHRLPNTLSVSLSNLNARQLVDDLHDRLACSTGSACHSSTEQSHSSTTLKAIGLPWQLANGTIRLSTSVMTSDDQIDQAILLITDAIKRQFSSSHNGHH